MSEKSDFLVFQKKADNRISIFSQC